MSGKPRHIIAPSLFDYVVDYAAGLKAGKEATTKSVSGDNGLVVFAENFLVQFSVGYLNRRIEGFNDRSQAQLTAERRRLEAERGTVAAQRLIFHLEPLCSRLAEISYSDSEQDAEEFHLDYVPELVRHIVAWLDEYGAEQALKSAAATAASAYGQAIGLEPT